MAPSPWETDNPKADSSGLAIQLEFLESKSWWISYRYHIFWYDLEKPGIKCAISIINRPQEAKSDSKEEEGNKFHQMFLAFDGLDGIPKGESWELHCNFLSKLIVVSQLIFSDLYIIL